MTEKQEGEHLYTVYKSYEEVPDRPRIWWDGLTMKEKKDHVIWMMGTAEGRNLISTAIQFLLDFSIMGGKRRDMALAMRETLFNCHPVNPKFDIDSVLPYLEIVQKDGKK